ncbi:unnamed protein product [Litomosoides sigmodontis]|uniref:Uncharacterized protein n=1 Tax=Litomosoides sigmodontis TaxID=42156 RepID=A0A3P6V4V7_LITSI|nr:unnamed protein product [Litomosoides sigmodontis]
MLGKLPSKSTVPFLHIQIFLPSYVTTEWKGKLLRALVQLSAGCVFLSGWNIWAIMSRYSPSDRYYMFDDINRWNPLASFTRPSLAECADEPAIRDSINNFKVEALFDYSLLKCGYHRQKIIQFGGIAPIIEDEDETHFATEPCHLEYRRRTRGTSIEATYSMEVPVALTRYSYPNFKFDVVSTKLFLAMLCRFIDNERRFYRFDIERIRDLIIIKEAPYGDARASKTYLQGALDILTGRIKNPETWYSRANMDYRQVSLCQFGTKRILLRQNIDLAEPFPSGPIHTPVHEDQSSSGDGPKAAFIPILENAVKSASEIDGSSDQPDPMVDINGSRVTIMGPVVPEPPIKPIEVMCRSFQRFSFANLQIKWPNMVFSGADRIVSVLHLRGLIDHKPKSFSFEEIAPKGYKDTLARAWILCREIIDFIMAIDREHDRLALMWHVFNS